MDVTLGLNSEGKERHTAIRYLLFTHRYDKRAGICYFLRCVDLKRNGREWWNIVLLYEQKVIEMDHENHH